MNRKHQIIYVILLSVGLLLITTLFFWSNKISVIHPDGLIAIKERNILVFATLLMLIVVIPVFVLTFVFAWRYHKDNNKANYAPDWDNNWFLEVLWWGVPFVIIAILSVITWRETHKLDPYKSIASTNKPVTIEVVALNWKWLFLYPDHGVASVNYFQFPTDTPINFVITAEAPMNSFWIPSLSGQIFAMPKMRTELHIMSDKEGKFRGSSANLSGKGFAGMNFTAEAVSESDFQKWLKEGRRSHDQLDWRSYKKLAEPSEYVPPHIYRLRDVTLFDQIIEQYLKPREDADV
ncbi:MAG: ubiquinol oxidase subunit II [Chlamydiales bacterium]|nr:ubiquinol oxidase subunit II [Chlamydiales bacterium]